MCKLIVGVNNTENTEKIKEMQRIVELQKGELFSQPHGMAAMVVGRNNKILIWRDLEDYETILKNVLKHLPFAKFFIIHTRISTGGSGIENVHLFEDRGVVMAHNGTIQKYNGWKWNKHSQTYFNDDTQKECDTLQFLKDLPKPITKEGIETLCNEKNLNGVAVVFDKGTKEAFLICKRAAKVILDPEQEFGLFFSYIPDKEVKIKYWQEVFGVRLEDEEETFKLGHTTTDSEEGVFKITV